MEERLVPLGIVAFLKVKAYESIMVNISRDENKWLSLVKKIGKFEILSLDMLRYALNELKNQKVLCTFYMSENMKDVTDIEVVIKKIQEEVYLFEYEVQKGTPFTLTYYDKKKKIIGSMGHMLTFESEGEYLYDYHDGKVFDILKMHVEKGDGKLCSNIFADEVKKERFGIIKSLYPHNMVIKPNKEYIKSLEERKDIPITRMEENILGSAYLISNIGNKMQKYQIRIINIVMKDFFTFTFIGEKEENLSKLVGGMSGSPIVKSGKIVGCAMAYVASDPRISYGIRISEMIE